MGCVTSFLILAHVLAGVIFKGMNMNQKFLWASFVLLVVFCIFLLLAPSKLADALSLGTQLKIIEERSQALEQMVAKPNYRMDSQVVAGLLRFELEQSKQYFEDTKSVLKIQFWLGLVLGGLLLVHLSALLHTRKYKQ